PLQAEAPVLSCEAGELSVIGTERFHVRQRRQILHVHDMCNECGNCGTFCVHQGRPYEDKPRLFLEREGFEQQEGDAIYICGPTIRQRAGGEERSLERHGDRWWFEDRVIRVVLSPDFSLQSGELKEPFAGRRSLRPALYLAVIYSGLRSSASHLLADPDGR
ncbi:MAG: putative selenate reductase subunit YgfK, partial [Candidatus Bipolaricaulota bacterium]